MSTTKVTTAQRFALTHTNKSTEFQLLWKAGFCNPSNPKCLFLKPQTSRFRHTNHQKKRPGNKHETKTHILVQCTKQTFKMGSQSRTKTKKNWTPGSPFLCSQVPLDRPMFPQDVKVEAAGMPNDRFWPPKLKYPSKSVKHIKS